MRRSERSTESPMPGLEFTHRASPVPAWRRGDDEQSNLKRTHSAANPPMSPFTPQQPHSKVIVGDNMRFLFNPSIPASIMTPPPMTPEIDMKDIGETSPSPRRTAQDRLADITIPVDKEDSSGEKVHDETDVAARTISNAAPRRVLRQRKEAKNTSMVKWGRGPRVDDELSDEDEEGDDDEGSSLMRRRSRIETRKTSNHYTLNMPGPVSDKPDTPYVLLGYVQLLFNLSLVLVFLYLLMQFILTVQRDVEQRISEYSLEILQDISTCATLFKTNLCDTPIPAMTHQCAIWETCMSRDIQVPGRAKVVAEMLAEVVNGFVDTISWKTLAFTLSSLAFLTVFVNALLSLFRSRHDPSKHHPNSHLQLHPSHGLVHPLQVAASHSFPGLPPPSDSPLAMMGWSGAWHQDEKAEGLPPRRRKLER